MRNISREVFVFGGVLEVVGSIIVLALVLFPTLPQNYIIPAGLILLGFVLQTIAVFFAPDVEKRNKTR